MTRRRPPLIPSPQDGVRVHKALADAGLGSRREIEGWIRDGRVRINGRIARLGERVHAADHIRVDGKEIKRGRANREPLRVIAYNKPVGELVTRSDPQGRKTLFGRLPPLRSGRWIAVGRLDINSSGLVLLTNNGELANRLMHPGGGLEREYAVRVLGEVSEQALVRLTHGVELDDGPARFEEIVASGGEGANRWFHVLLREGRKREVRRLWEAVGCRVSRLVRVRFGNVILGPRVFAGHWRKLTPLELEGLLELAAMPRPAAPVSKVPQSKARTKPPKGRPAATAGRSDRETPRRRMTSKGASRPKGGKRR